MKNAWRARAAFVIVSAFVVVGCDSTQPDRIETRTAVLSFKTRANVNLWTCYETPNSACFTLNDSTGNPRREDRTVPWRYSVKVTIIRAGTVDEVLATSLTGVAGSSVEPGDLVTDFISLGNYDLDAPAAPDRVINGVQYSNGKIVGTGSPIYLATISIDPGITNLLDALPATPTASPTFEFNLNTGDTVVVRARKQANAAAPQFVPALTGVQLSGTLALSGVTVPVLGTQTSPPDDKAGFTFSFTVQ
jgi:hypothetical protein